MQDDFRTRMNGPITCTVFTVMDAPAATFNHFPPWVDADFRVMSASKAAARIP